MLKEDPKPVRFNEDLQIFTDAINKGQPKMQVKILNGNKEAIQRNLDEYHLHLKYAMKKNLKPELFQTYLMNQINPLREYLSLEDFTSVIGT